MLQNKFEMKIKLKTAWFKIAYLIHFQCGSSIGLPSFSRIAFYLVFASVKWFVTMYFLKCNLIENFGWRNWYVFRNFSRSPLIYKAEGPYRSLVFSSLILFVCWIWPVSFFFFYPRITRNLLCNFRTCHAHTPYVLKKNWDEIIRVKTS